MAPVPVWFLPVTNLFATRFFFSWTLAATFLYCELRYRIAATGLFVLFLNLLLLGSALPCDPAIQLRLIAADRLLWQGWYPLRQDCG